MLAKNIHVGIVHRRYAGAILDGSKSMEARLSVNRIVPYRRIEAGERVYFKQAGGPFFATALVDWVDTVDGINPCALRVLRDRYETRVLGGRAFWRSKARARYGSFIALIEPTPIAFGPDLSQIVKPGSRHAWFVLPGEMDVWPACAQATRVSLRPTG